MHGAKYGPLLSALYFQQLWLLQVALLTFSAGINPEHVRGEPWGRLYEN